MTSILRAVADLEANNRPGVLCTIVRSRGSTPRHTGSKMLVYPDAHFVGTVGGGELESRVFSEALQALQDGRPRLLEYQMAEPQRGDPGVCGGQVEVFVEPILPRPSVVVIGAGHVGKAVAHLAKWLDFYVVISDDRPELCNPETVPEGDQYLAMPMAEIPEHYEITNRAFLVLTTRNVNVDVPGLPALLATPAAYIGVIGSLRRWATTQEKLLQAGVPPEQLARVHSPMGLELRAETPEEIAVSILAEIIQQYRQGVQTEPVEVRHGAELGRPGETAAASPGAESA